MTEAGTAGHQTNHAQAVGTLADEAAQLLDAVVARLDRLKSAIPAPAQSGGGRDTAAPTEGGESEHIAGAGCVSWCPICRSAELLQGDRPELTGKLVDAALLLVTTVRSLIPKAETTGGAGPTPAGRPGVERIDIR